MIDETKILVTGGTGMIGTALKQVIPNATFVGSKNCDLTDHDATFDMMRLHKPKYIIHLAAEVGGIKANSDKVGDFCSLNLMINNNVLSLAAHSGHVEKVLSLMSTCVYPDKATYPLTEDQLHKGEPHESNFGYAYAKRMLDVQSRAYRKQYGCNFITAIPNNLFGPHDNFDLENSHVLPAMIRKLYEAKLDNKPLVELWGSGRPVREFTYSYDLANILVFLLEKYDGAEPLNIGNTECLSIAALAELVAMTVGYEGEFLWNTEKPDGQLLKPSDNTKFFKFGWSQDKYTLFDTALRETCKWFIDSYPLCRGIYEGDPWLQTR